MDHYGREGILVRLCQTVHYPLISVTSALMARNPRRPVHILGRVQMILVGARVPESRQARNSRVNSHDIINERVASPSRSSCCQVLGSLEEDRRRGGQSSRAFKPSAVGLPVVVLYHAGRLRKALVLFIKHLQRSNQFHLHRANPSHRVVVVS